MHAESLEKRLGGTPATKSAGRWVYVEPGAGRRKSFEVEFDTNGRVRATRWGELVIDVH